MVVNVIGVWLKPTTRRQFEAGPALRCCDLGCIVRSSALRLSPLLLVHVLLLLLVRVCNQRIILANAVRHHHSPVESLVTEASTSLPAILVMPLLPNGGPGSMARVSVFKELGLTIDEPEERSDLDTIASSLLRSPAESSSQGTHDDQSSRLRSNETDIDTGARKRWYRRILSRISFVRPWLRPGSPSGISPAAFPTLTHVVMLVLLFLIVLPGLRLSVPIGRARYTPPLAYAGIIRVPRSPDDADEPTKKRLEARANSPTDACVRWSHQCESKVSIDDWSRFHS